MPPKAAAAPKGQKSLFSFFQKAAGGEKDSDAKVESTKSSPAHQHASPAAEGAREVSKDATPTNNMSASLTMYVHNGADVSPLVKNAVPLKTSAPECDSDSEFELALKKKRGSATGSGGSGSKRPKLDESEDEWMESADEKISVDEDDLSLSASDASDDFIVESDDENVKTKKSAKKPPLGKKPARPAAASKARTAMSDSTPLRASASNSHSRSASPAGTPGYISSAQNTPMASATPMTTSSGQSIQLPEGVVGRGSHEHNFFTFLQPENRKDIKGRKQGDPLYNPRSLNVPDAFLRDQTPAMAQWWHFKARHMDTVLFFKVGKFYELFHMDADVGFSELDLIYMKGAKAHSGFPEVSYGKFASVLVSKGYRVARVEQTETPEMLKERNDSAVKGKKDKVVAREVCAVMTRGTRTFCHLDDLSLLEEGQAAAMATSMLVGIKEAVRDGVRELGICSVDTILGAVTLAQFQDDAQLSRLRTFLARFHPTEVLLEEGAVSQEVLGVVRLVAPQAALDLLKPAEEFPSAGTTMEGLRAARYFCESSSHEESDMQSWPPVLHAVVQGYADGSSALVLSAMGAALWQLRRSLIDYEVLSMRKVFAYVPPDDDAPEAEDAEEGEASQPEKVSTLSLTVEAEAAIVSCPVPSSATAAAPAAGCKHLTLDEMALTNLEVLLNNQDRSEAGTLWAFVNRTKTPFGRRLLRSWLCHPLFVKEEIEARHRALDELLTSLAAEADSCRATLKLVPDLERLLARVHSNGLQRQGAADHPDSRAVMYESQTHNMRKIRDFADLLSGLEQVLKAVCAFQAAPVAAKLLRAVVPCADDTASIAGASAFPLAEVRDLLGFFRSVFDERQAKRDGNIKPHPGVNAEYDQAVTEVSRHQQDLEHYLQDLKRSTGISDIKFFGTNKDRFQLEVPMSMTARVPADWTSKSQKKTHRRYWTPAIERMLPKLAAAEERVVAAQKDTLRAIFSRFDGNRAVWDRAVSCAAQLDALLSLATISSLPGYCWPQIAGREGGPQLRVVQGRHPMLEHVLAQRGDGEFIPNDLALGGSAARGDGGTAGPHREFDPRLLLLTGPNMGGKSTLLRQTCLLVILAQIGCRVPAQEMVLTPVDRIFTRIGASDRIMHGQSTFFVELAETSMILHAATEDSLCILDELGRGTATFDGTAVAHSVVNHLVSRKRCRALFATHYHLLVEDWEVDPRVQLGHMDCVVQRSEADAGTPAAATAGGGPLREEVTFLYKLCDGASPKSYGIHVAQLAGVPEAILALARAKSHGLEAQTYAMLRGEEAGAPDEASAAGAMSRLDYFRHVSAVFDALVSIFDQSRAEHKGVRLTDDEFVFLVAELWKRFESYRLHTHK